MLLRIAQFTIGIIVLIGLPATSLFLYKLISWWWIPSLILVIVFKEITGPIGFNMILASIYNKSQIGTDQKSFVVFLRPFESDGDSAYPLQAGSKSSQKRLREELSIRNKKDDDLNKSKRYFSFRFPGAKLDPASIGWGMAYELLIRFATKHIGDVLSFENEKEGTTSKNVLNRIPSEQNSWESKVTHLLRESALVIIRPGESRGIRFEMTLVRRFIEPNKVLLFFPVNGMLDREDNYNSLKAIVEIDMQCKMPDNIPDHLCFLGFDHQWNVILEDYKRSIPMWVYGCGLTAVSLTNSLKARGLPYRKRPPILATINLPLNLIIGLSIFLGVLGRLIQLIFW